MKNFIFLQNFVIGAMLCTWNSMESRLASLWSWIDDAMRHFHNATAHGDHTHYDANNDHDPNNDHNPNDHHDPNDHHNPNDHDPNDYHDHNYYTSPNNYRCK